MNQALAIEKTLIPTSKTEHFFKLLFGANMCDYPKRSSLRGRSGAVRKYDHERQWVFVGSREKMKSMASLSTLYAVINDEKNDTTYYTPNGYYRRGLRWTDTLRWLNAFVLDIDTKGESILDVMERIQAAALPEPTAIIKTPSGGYHITYIFNEPIRATAKAITLYTAIMQHMAEDIGADPAAVAANRIFRTPTDENLVYFSSQNCYDFQEFKDWRDLNHPYDPKAIGYRLVNKQNLMSQEAIQVLLNSPCPEGQRDMTALTLALAMKASDWSPESAESELTAWYHSCCDRHSSAGNKPFTLRDVLHKVKYVYARDQLHAPKAEIVRQLSGVEFYYRTMNFWDSAKPREERERVHLTEWEQDLLHVLSKKGRLEGSQKEIASNLGCPLASFKLIVSRLSESNTIKVHTTRGRGGKTVIWLAEPPQSEKKAKDKIIRFPIQRNTTSSIPENKKLNTKYETADIITLLKVVKRVFRNAKLPDKPPD